MNKEEYEKNEKIRCNWCGIWVGKEEDLIVKDDIEYCPHCKKEGCLMDIINNTIGTNIINRKK